MLRSSYDATNANIKVKINNVWQPANSRLREIYIKYKSLPLVNGRTSYSKYGITIFRTENDPYMPTFYQWDGRNDTEVENTNNNMNENSSIQNNDEYYGEQEATPTPTPIIDFNDIYIFLINGVTGPESRNGAGWVKARNYQVWAFVDFIYDTCERKFYASRYSSYSEFPAGFNRSNVVFIDIDGLAPNIIFSISRNDNNSVYYEKNDQLRTRVRICDNELARQAFLGFYTRLIMDDGIVITTTPIPTPTLNTHNNTHGILSNGSSLLCIGDKPPISDLTDNEEEQCIMCYENKKNVHFHPCNHIISCYRCVQQMNKCECPICKSKIHTIQYVIQ